MTSRVSWLLEYSRNLLGTLHPIVCNVYTAWCVKKKTNKIICDNSSEKPLFLREVGRQDWFEPADRKTVVTEINTLYKHGEQKSNAQPTMRLRAGGQTC